MSGTERRTFVIAEMEHGLVALDAGDLVAVEPVGAFDAKETSAGPSRSQGDPARTLGAPLPEKARHLLHIRRGDLELRLPVRSAAIESLELACLYQPPRLIARAMSRLGLRALLRLEDERWACVLDPAAASIAAKETKQ